MRFCSLEFLEELVVISLVMWFCSLILILPRTPLPRLFSSPKPWKYSSKNPFAKRDSAVSTPDLANPTVGLRCYEFGWGEASARVSNRSTGAEPTICLTCERFRYFEYAAEEAVFKYDTFFEELALIEAANHTVSVI